MQEKIAVIGSSFIDCKGYVKEEQPDNLNYGDIQLAHGGVGHNIAENLGVLGLHPHFISTLDNGPFGFDIKEKLENKGVKTNYMLPINSGAMGIWMAIMNSKGDVTSAVTQLPDYSQLEKYIDKYGEKFAKEFDSLVLELDISEKLSRKVINSFKKNKRKIFVYSANLNRKIEELSILEEVDCLILSEKSISLLMGFNISSMEIHQIQKSFKEFIKKNNLKRGVITLHKRGTVFYDNVLNQTSFVEPAHGGILDLSGEGEALFSAVVVSLLQGMDLKDAVTKGTDFSSRGKI